MPKIRCHYLDCIFLDEKYCSAAAVEIDPDSGCRTYKPNEDEGLDINHWEDDDELDDWGDMDAEDENEDLWIDEDDELDDEDDDF